MGYFLAIPIGLLVILLLLLLVFLFSRRAEASPERDRLDYRKGTTYNEPQEEGGETNFPVRAINPTAAGSSPLT